MCVVPSEPTLLQGPWPLVEVRLLPDRRLEMYSVLVKGDSMKGMLDIVTHLCVDEGVGIGIVVYDVQTQLAH